MKATAAGPFGSFTLIDGGRFEAATYLFFVSAEVCEDKKGDCQIQVAEKKTVEKFDPMMQQWTRVDEESYPRRVMTPPNYRPSLVVRPGDDAPLSEKHPMVFSPNRGSDRTGTIIFADVPTVASSVIGGKGDIRRVTVVQEVVIMDAGVPTIDSRATKQTYTIMVGFDAKWNVVGDAMLGGTP